ncbi:MAG: SusC/RagA family TonB-linked outer membrane protein [Bacteroidales bacterium]|nr:SusC/RagA family TonB-linked outer membrane protein [Bacteroidales bacterium]MCL2132938.1 SusC/RagA family TonB-linked outer membrane protein [Bacteroidales bacterium]
MKLKLNLLCLLFLITGILQAQNLTIRGTVFDEANQPLVGATVMVKGTKQFVVADINGNYTLNNVPSNATLVVSFMGYQTIEEAVNGREQINVQLQLDATVLREVVVTGMASVDKRLFTGAADRLEAADVKLGGITEISRALEGRSAGVSVQNVSGTFGAAPKIRVRGATSIYGSSKPLWVVDGIIMEDVVDIDSDALSSGDAETLISSAIAGLNADDIESFQILKDGSATSIYGARAMSGVIVVTTKKGRAGVSSINYNGEFTTRLIPTYSEFNIMNSQEQMGVYQEMEQKGWLGFAGTIRSRNSGVYGRMYKLMTTVDPGTGGFVLRNSEEDKNAYLRLAEFRNTDWFQELFNLNVVQSHAVSMSGGTDKTMYYASLSALVDPGWYKGSGVNRYTGALNATYNIKKNLSLNFITNTSTRLQKAPGSLDQSVDAVYGEVKRDFDINPYSYALNTSRAMNPTEIYTRNYADFNILNELENNYMDVKVTDFKFQAELKWKIIPELEISALGAYKSSASNIEHHIKDNSNQAMAYRAMPDATIRNRNSFLYTDPDIPYVLPISVLPEGGIYNRTDNRMQGYDFRTSITWNKIFNDVHITNFFGGTELKTLERNRTYFRGWGRLYTMGDVSNYAYQVFKQSSEQGTQYYSIADTREREAAFFGLATYSYMSKYILNATFRYEGTNRLGESTSARWLPTWNIAGSYNVHEEEFFEHLRPALSHLSLRASYSLTGDRGPRFVTNSEQVLMPTVSWKPWGDYRESSLYIDDIENSELTYEKKHELNIGADIGFLGNRINLVTDVFWRNNYDLIGRIATQGVGGTVDKYANVAEMKSHGVEFTLTTKNLEMKDFSWSTNFIFGYVKTEITKLDSRSRVLDLVSGNGFGMPGYSHRTLFSIPFVGLSEDGFPILLNQDGLQTSNTTYVYFQERVKMGFLIYEGPTEPTITGSLGNIFTYKNFRLNVFLTYAFGNKLRLNRAFKSSYSDLDAMPKEFANRWVVPGDEAYTNIPVIPAARQLTGTQRLTYHYNAYNFSDVRVADGGFIRLKEVSLSYDLPSQWASAVGVKNMSAKIQGTNLLLLYADSKLNGQDPEFFQSGGVSAPVPKQITLTLKLGL